jgi:hypothetical protein
MATVDSESGYYPAGRRSQMEAEGRKQNWIERLFEYDEEKAKVEQLGRAIYKWFLEFIRN